MPSLKKLSLDAVLALAKDFKLRQRAVLDVPVCLAFIRISMLLRKSRGNPWLLYCPASTHVSAPRKKTLRIDTCIKCHSNGEYDFTLKELAATLQSGGDLKRSARPVLVTTGSHAQCQQSLYKNLDDLRLSAGFIKRHLKIENYFYSITKHPQITIMTSRGCPYQCSFCVYPQTIHGHTYRRRSVQCDRRVQIHKERIPSSKRNLY